MIDILIYILQGHESGGSGDPEQGCSGFRGLISFTFRGRWPSVPREREACEDEGSCDVFKFGRSGQSV